MKKRFLKVNNSLYKGVLSKERKDKQEVFVLCKRTHI